MNKRLRVWLRRFAALFQKTSGDRELSAELQSHLELHLQDNLSRGLTLDEARREALMKLGGIEQTKELYRERSGLPIIETLVQDLRFAVRTLLKSPGFTFIVVLTLALGIGANSAIFSVINGVLLNPLPYKSPEQLVVRRGGDSLLNVMDTQKQMHAFSEGGGINTEEMDYTGGSEPLQVHVGLVDAQFLQTLGVKPALGRLILPEEDVKGGPRFAVVSYSFWQNYLGSDPALGKSIPLNGNSYSVIGVMPSDFALPHEPADIFVSLWVGYPEAAAYRGVHFLRTYWRLKPDVTLAQAQSDIDAVDRHIAELNPVEEKNRRTRLIPLHESLVGDVRPALLVLFAAVGLVLLIACANFASLLMSRAVAQRQELVIRAALGAGRTRLIRKTLTESALLSILGGAAGLLLAQWGVRALLALRPEKLARLSGIHMDTRVLLFVLVLSLLTGIVFGMAPAWIAASADVAEALKESGRSSTASVMGHRLRKILVTAELALALVLLVGAGLLIKGFSRLRSLNPGFNPANVTTLYLQLPAKRYAEILKQTYFRRELLSRLNALPDVQAAMISDIPLGGEYLTHSFAVDGRPPVPVGTEPMVQSLALMGDYFRVMQIPLRAGRDFAPSDREGQPLVAVVNEELVKQYFPREDPIGQRVRWARDTEVRWMTIIGVVGDVKHFGLNQPSEPAVYSPFSQTNEEWRRWMTLVIRTGDASPGLLRAVKEQIWSLDSQIPASHANTMEELMSLSFAQQRFNMLLLGLFAALALILAAVGIYGAMSYSVSQRIHEIGIRTALGAQRQDVFRLVMSDGARIAVLGITIGIAGALALTQLMKSLLFEVQPTDPATFLSVALLLALVVLAACYIPARRATRVDPMVALRYE
jgi:putative ABC transport system permease protein